MAFKLQSWGLCADHELQHATQGGVAPYVVSLRHGGAPIYMNVPQNHKVMVGFTECEGHNVPGKIAWVSFLRLRYSVA